MSDVTAPLEGVRVLDFTQNLPGPYATFLLASMGAEVIKVEPPRGDPARGMGRIFNLVNAGKKCVVVNLKQEDERQQLLDLLPGVDVLVEGFRPGVMQRFGLDAHTVHAAHPEIVYCSLSAFGQEGPYTNIPGHDLNLQALIGACHAARDEHGEPAGYAIPLADLSTSLTAVASITAALYRRQRDGKGATLDISLADTLLSWVYVWSEGLSPEDVPLSGLLKPTRKWLGKQANHSSPMMRPIAKMLQKTLAGQQADQWMDSAADWLRKRGLIDLVDRLHLHVLPHYNLYRTKDGRYISFGIVDEEHFWRSFCEQAGIKPLAQIPIWARFVASKPLSLILKRLFRQRTLAQWLETIDLEKVPLAPVLSIKEAMKDPQIRNRNFSQDQYQLSPMPQRIHLSGKAPRKGQHNDEIFGAADATT